MTETDPIAPLLAEQIAYYRAIAGEYEDHAIPGPGESELVAALDAFAPAGDVLELACGPGAWTERLLRHAATLTSVDAAPEMLARARARVGDGRVRFVQADIFGWVPDRRYDVVFLGFWLSHVPLERFDAFWSLVAACLVPGGRVFFVDDGHRTPEELVEGEASSTVRRRLNDGTAFRAIKVPHGPRDLEERLRGLGWNVSVTRTSGPFYWGAGSRVPDARDARPAPTHAAGHAAQGGGGAPSRLLVWCLEPLEDALKASLASALDPRVDLACGDAPPAPPGPTWIVGGRPSAEALEASPRLAGLIVPFAGVPKGVRELLRTRPEVAVHNLHHNAAATAELGMALLLAAAKGIVPADRALRSGDWTPRFESAGPMLLDGRRVVVYGHGAVGRRMGVACRALGMEVHAVRRERAGSQDASFPAASEEGRDGVFVHAKDELIDCLRLADVLVVAVPLTPETEGSIGARELALLPRGALLVNIARGPVVDEAALHEALRSGQLGGAGLDVWYRYPGAEDSRTSTPPSRFPFGELPSVVMSPHRGGNMDRGDELWVRELARLLNAAARGEPVPNRVSLERGY